MFLNRFLWFLESRAGVACWARGDPCDFSSLATVIEDDSEDEATGQPAKVCNSNLLDSLKGASGQAPCRAFLG